MATSVDKKTGVGFDGILFIHQPTFTYNYIKDKTQLEKDWAQFELNPGLYNWTDAPSVAPKITFGKEERARKSKAKATLQKVDPSAVIAKTHGVTGLKPTRSKPAPETPTVSTPRARR
jgi:hypothetical protein